MGHIKPVMNARVILSVDGVMMVLEQDSVNAFLEAIMAITIFQKLKVNEHIGFVYNGI